LDTNFAKVLDLAKKYEPEMSRFLRDLIAIPGESCDEKGTVLRIKEEMEKVGFDKVEIDPQGNILGYVGHGKHIIAMDAHIDTVGVGSLENWDYDPYKGFEDDEIIIGRGASDQIGGMASMVYAGKIIKDLGLEGDYTLVVVGSVQEEDCDGLCWQYIIKEDKLVPEFVVITEPTDGKIYRGHRGRMEIKVLTKGVSCHGSAPERGDNAIYKMAPILQELRGLHENLLDHPFLGKGSLTVSEIFHTSPSRCAVADTYKGLFGKDPVVDKWTFSTNGVSIMGRYGIPCIGFGPGHEDQAHAPNERTWKKELVDCAAMYAMIPSIYVQDYADKMPKDTENLVKIK